MSEATYRVTRYGRFWRVSDNEGQIIAIVVYRKGVEGILRELERLSGRRVVAVYE